MNDFSSSGDRTDRDLVSIGLPIYNGEMYMREALDSLLKQTHHNFEIIISDNGSTDLTRQICDEYVAKDNRIRYFRQPLNLGPVPNFKFVLEQARGDVFMWAAHDDLWEPSHLASAIAFLKDRGLSFVFPSFRLSSIQWKFSKTFDNKTFAFMESTDARLRTLSFMSLHYLSHSANIVYSVFRRSFLEAVWEVQNIGNDGAMGAVILSMGRGAVNSARFSKRYAGMWPGRLQGLMGIARATLGGSNPAEQAKHSIDEGRSKLIQLFPGYAAEINYIYDRYRPFNYLSNYQICSIE